MKKDIWIVLTLIFLLAFVAGATHWFSYNRYRLDTTNRYTLTASIIDVLEGTLIHESDHHRFYLLLRTMEEDPSGTPTEWLETLGIRFAHEDSHKGARAVVKLRYKSFCDDGLYVGGFDLTYETKRLEVRYAFTSLIELEIGDTVVLFDSICAEGLTPLENGGDYITCEAVDAGTYELPLYEDVSDNLIVTPYYKRSFLVNQSRYGYEKQYNPVITFTYQTKRFVTPRATLTLIDNDKLYIQYDRNENFAITKRFHYDRNQYNVSFDAYIEESSVGSGIAYFHQLGAYTGDESNIHNRKLTVNEANVHQGIDILSSFPNATSEAIYRLEGSGMRLVEEDFIMGSFNLSDARIVWWPPLSMNEHIKTHYIFDVYPYLVWGNSDDDSTTLRERLIWDRASYAMGGNELRVYRGEDLYGHVDAMISPHLQMGDYDVEQILDVLYRRLRWNAGTEETS